MPNPNTNAYQRVSSTFILVLFHTGYFWPHGLIRRYTHFDWYAFHRHQLQQQFCPLVSAYLVAIARKRYVRERCLVDPLRMRRLK